MASFVLVPGAGGMAWYWHRAVPLIRAAGHEPIAVDLPGDDRHAGLAAYVDIVIRAIAERSDVILVAQSLAGFTAPLVCARAPVRMVVFVNAMIPKPGETAGAWWDAPGAAEAREQAAARRGYATEFDVGTSARRPGTTTRGSRDRFRRALSLRALARNPHSCSCGKRRPFFPDRISTPRLARKARKGGGGNSRWPSRRVVECGRADRAPSCV